MTRNNNEINECKRFIFLINFGYTTLQAITVPKMEILKQAKYLPTGSTRFHADFQSVTKELALEKN